MHAVLFLIIVTGLWRGIRNDEHTHTKNLSLSLIIIFFITAVVSVVTKFYVEPTGIMIGRDRL